MKILFLFTLLLIAKYSYSQTRSFGHLLSRNDYLLEEKRCAIGFEFSGCRIGDKTVIGVSPFLIDKYELKNIYLRRHLGNSKNAKHTIDFGIVDNIKDNRNLFDEDGYISTEALYDMSVFMANFITTFNFDGNIKLHWNNSVFYYPNYRRPFSLRRPDPKVKKLQVNSSVLFENPFNKYITMMSEIGLIQLNGKYPRIHGGASLDIYKNNLLIKIGFSITSTVKGFFVDADNPERYDYQQALIGQEDGFYQELNEDKVKNDFSLHPELNIQYTF